MTQAINIGKARLGASLACLIAFVSMPFAAHAQQSDPVLAEEFGNGFSLVHDDGPGILPFLLGNRTDLAFDTGTSATRKLELQLSQPFLFNVLGETRTFDGGQSILAASGIEFPVGENLDMGLGVLQQESDFTPLGSIQCQGGILDAGSYRASNCFFTNSGNHSTRQSVSLDAGYSLGENSLASLSLFHEESRSGSPVAGQAGTSILDSSQLIPGLTSPFSTSTVTGMLPDFIDSEVSGIGLEFQLGISTDNAGEMQLGLQFTRVFDAHLEGAYPFQGNLARWTLAEPVDSARISFDWQRSAFSGGIQGYYREPMQFLDQAETDGLAMFDVYFSWRAPWNASFSVGASNLLNNADDKKPAENTLADPFESIYGRIPYVRYKQDL